MTAIIAPDDIKEIYPQAAGLSDCVIQDFICIVDQADQCLAGAGYNSCACTVIKKYSVAHMLYSVNNSDFKSLTSPTGESVTFKDSLTQTGMTSTPFGRMVLSLDKQGCISAVIENTEADRFFVSVGC